MKLHTIVPGCLYQRGHMEAFNAADKQRELDARRITMVVGLARRPDPDLSLLYRYIHHPVPDGKYLDEATFETLAAEVVTHIREGRGAALIHCNAGRNRSGLLNALVWRELDQCTGAAAMEVVRAGRPRAIANPVFVEYLERLDVP